ASQGTESTTTSPNWAADWTSPADAPSPHAATRSLIPSLSRTPNRIACPCLAQRRPRFPPMFPAPRIPIFMIPPCRRAAARGRRPGCQDPAPMTTGNGARLLRGGRGRAHHHHAAAHHHHRHAHVHHLHHGLAALAHHLHGHALSGHHLADDSVLAHLHEI